MQLVLVHHGETVDPLVDARQPLSHRGRQSVARLASEAALRGVLPSIVWHSGKLRARQTAEEFWRACNALATLSAIRGLQPGDPPTWMRDRIRGEAGDILLAGHYPHLPRLLGLLLTSSDAVPADFPRHGVVALRSDDRGETWSEVWRLLAFP